MLINEPNIVHKHEMEKLLDSWFIENTKPNLSVWFRAKPTELHRQYFEPLVQDALEGNLDHWKSSPQGIVALMILFDQLPRLLYSNSPKMCIGDEKAIQLLKEIDDLTKSSLPVWYQFILTEPLAHSENETFIQQSIEQLQQIKTFIEQSPNDHSKSAITFIQEAISHAEENLAIISKFKRYPHRNQLLSREQSLEELEFDLNIKRPWLARVQELRYTHKPALKVKKLKSQVSTTQITTRKLRILVFHGRTQNGRLFKSRVTKLRTAVKDLAELIFIDAPHLCEEENHSESIPDIFHKGDKRCWWYVDDTPQGEYHYHGLDKTLLELGNLFLTHAPIDGVIGFSQGSILTSILAALRPKRFDFSFLISISGHAARDTKFVSHFTPGAIEGLPSLHIIAQQDTKISPALSEFYAECFSNPEAVVSKHEGSHFSPNKWPLNTIAQFLLEQQEKLSDLPVEHHFESLEQKLIYNQFHSDRDEAFNRKPAGLDNKISTFLETSNEWQQLVQNSGNLQYPLVERFFDSIYSELESKFSSDEETTRFFEDLLCLAFFFRPSQITIRGVRKQLKQHSADGYLFGLVWISQKLPAQFLSFLPHIPILGSWKDFDQIVQCQIQVNPECGTRENLERSELVQEIIRLIADQLLKDQKAMNELLSSGKYQTHSIGELIELGLWPSKCGLEAPRISSGAKKTRIPQSVALRIFPMKIPQETPAEQQEAILNSLKGKSCHKYTSLVSALSKLLLRAEKDYYASLLASHRRHHFSQVDSEKAWNELLQAPISTEIIHPRPQPVIPCSLEDLQPLLVWLDQNVEATEQTAFAKGTIVPDGRLDLCKQVVGPKGIEPLINSMQRNSQVKRLLLGNNIVGDLGAKVIAEAIRNNSIPSMDTWYIAGNQFTASGIELIANELHYNHTVKALWLKRNPLLPAGAKHISTLLAVNQYLQVLDLDLTGLLDEGLRYVIQGLSQNTTLRHLYLNANGITIEGAKLIGDYLAAGLNCLESLFLGVNRLGDEGCQEIVRGLAVDKNLRRLCLGSNRITDAGVATLVDGLISSGHPLVWLDLGFLKSTIAVRELGNRITDVGAQHLAKLLTHNTTLRSLSFHYHLFTSEGVSALAKALENNHSLISTGETRFSKEPVLSKHINSLLERNRKEASAAFPDLKLEEIDIPQHVNEIFSVYRTKNAEAEPFLHHFNWLQVDDIVAELTNIANN